MLIKNKRSKQENISGRKIPRKLDYEKTQTLNSLTEEESRGEPAIYLGETEWLNDIHINDYMILLKTKYPRYAGLQYALLQQKKTIPYPWTHIHADFIHIFLVNDNHRVCVEREKNPKKKK